MHRGLHPSDPPVRMESETARRMADAAAAFVASLSREQKEPAVFPVESEERFSWDYRLLNPTGSRNYSDSTESRSIPCFLIRFQMVTRLTFSRRAVSDWFPPVSRSI